MKIYLMAYLCLAVLFYNASAQEKRDYTWLSGSSRTNLDPPGTMLDFRSIPVDISRVQILGHLYGSSVISDTSGQLLFYSDGCMVMNREHQLMENGDSINVGVRFRRSCVEDSSGYKTNHGNIILPWPEHPDWYVMYHLCHRNTAEPGLITHLLYTIVDMDTPDGLGRVVLKNQVLAEGNFMDGITAVRHGNGRDWWVVIPDCRGEEISMHLLDPGGPARAGSTRKVPSHAPPMKSQICISSQLVFSPDGTQFARASANGDVLVFQFDRCAGTFSCPKLYEVKKYAGAGTAFSPNSRFLYVSTSLYLHQIDLWNHDAKPVLIAEWDGFVDPFPTTFYHQRLGPDGKIYICCTNGARQFHCINAPDLAGAACDFRQHSIPLPTYNTIGINNFPYYRLYDLPRSVCDTLGIDAPPGVEPSPDWVTQEGIFVQPNPAQDWAYLSVAACERGRLRIYDASGRTMYERPDFIGPERIDLDVSEWPTGVYFIQLNEYRQYQQVRKLVIVR
jgi:Secretion system C-terminal sorting domain